MALTDYERDMAGCSRCSSCKWLPLNQIKSWRFAKNCPAMVKYNFHAYSGSGRMIMGLSMLQGRSELNEAVADILYRCQLCGACDVACKVYRDDIDVVEVLEEMRIHCVEQGQLIPEHLAVIDALKHEDNVMGEPKAERGAWAEGLGLKDINKERAEVIFHAGCRFSYDKDLWEIARGAVKLLLKAGVDVGIAGREEACCGGRAYEMGYRGDAENYAEDVLSRVKASGASTLVTACSDGFSTFRYLYPRMGRELPVEVLHISEYLNRLIAEGRLQLTHEVPLLVTYHDPCHLGRRSDPFTGLWEGDKLLRPMSMKRTGKKGIYDAPREVLASIPGLELVEMERIREYSWCCGAGGGVLEAYPDFASWTAMERLEEAICTGAQALVTACPWCERSFRDALSENGYDLELYDLSELVVRASGA
ncbi:MAG: (Fe-S)-binding protein [Actinomycetota bacterium]|nr:(Fe-S)-binding protein [Actinomycetota bacterium]